MLPEELTAITIIEKFKTEVKKWVPENCPCRSYKTSYISQIGFVNVKQLSNVSERTLQSHHEVFIS